MPPSKHRRGDIPQGAVGPVVIVGEAILFCQDMRFQHAGQHFPVQKFIPQPTVKRFDEAIFPGTPGRNVRRLDGVARQVLSDGFGRKLRAVVTP